MDTFRYVLAVLVLVGYPPALAWWFIVHPFIGFWRRRGPKVTLWCLGVFYVACATGLLLVRDRVLRVDYGTSWALVATGAVLIAIGIVIAAQRKKQLGWRYLVGLPELDPDAEGGELLTEGIYARVRHPRYVEFLVGSLGYALVIHYRAVYLLTAAAWVGIYLIVLLEEKELRQRYGQAYVDYSARVPRFVPRFGSRSRS